MSLIGTKLYTWWKGEAVGSDSFGNKYFRERSGGRRRWVIFNGRPEASKVPPEWHAWLHHTIDDAPVAGVKKHVWEKEHLPNLTGTPYAYHPAGQGGGMRPKATGDYEAWKPE
ncbi:NADH:ubiquinone oxidoreductase subunit NDUFA12 [Ferrovibrio sp.]|uniref:NADH:ubiquinone oxidoreductase subunit NDUFA12 n=1 Tax=Ferrovibrio sp. TaxID=1917215 RepID=UPI003D0C50A2